MIQTETYSHQPLTHSLSHLLVNFTQHFSRRFGVEQPDDNPGVLPLQVGDGRPRIPEEALARGYPDARRLCPALQVIESLK